MEKWRKRKKKRKLAKKPLNGKIASRPQLYKNYVIARCEGLLYKDQCDMPKWAYHNDSFKKIRQFRHHRGRFGWRNGLCNGLTLMGKTAPITQDDYE